jgi:hypothetical protein
MWNSGDLGSLNYFSLCKTAYSLLSWLYHVWNIIKVHTFYNFVIGKKPIENKRI